jgi:hypothetical protein
LTIENCMIECSAHNRQRGTLTVEEYIRSVKNSDGLKSICNGVKS